MNDSVQTNPIGVTKKIPEEKRLTSPYNFVPTGRYIYYPEWEKFASYDHPVKNGMDGTMIVRITNVSPLFIRNGSEKCNSSEKSSCHIPEKEGKIRYFLPGSSLRGLWRFAVETLTFSQMDQFSNTIVSYRDYVDEEKNDTDFIIKARKSRAGWLQLSEGQWKLYPCKGNYYRISMNDVNRFCGGGDINEKVSSTNMHQYENSWDRNNYVFEKTNEMYPLFERYGKEYRIVCTGIKRINSDENVEDYKLKKREYLFPDETKGAIVLDNQFMNYFFKLHGQEKGFRKYRELLFNGRKVAVFYQKDDQGKIFVMGMSKINKIGRKYTPKELLDNHIANYDGNRYDLATLLFGYGGRASRRLRGKVQVGNALCTTLDPKPSEKDEKLPLLLMPRPTYNPLYIHQSVDQLRYKTFDDDDAMLAGRKYYRIHEGSSVIEREQSNFVEKAGSNPFHPFIPMKPGHVFECTINLHNVCPIEMGALLSAITLLGDKDAYHNIGIAKSLGYGKITTEVISIELSDNKYKGKLSDCIKYYMREFEKAMSLFTYSHVDLYDPNGETPLMWADTPTVKKFLGIRHEHPREEVGQMSRNAYRLVRKDENFQVLTEPRVTVPSLLLPSDRQEIIFRTVKDHLLANNSTPLPTRLLDHLSLLKNLRYFVLSGLCRFGIH